MKFRYLSFVLICFLCYSNIFLYLSDLYFLGSANMMFKLYYQDNTIRGIYIATILIEVMVITNTIYLVLYYHKLSDASFRIYLMLICVLIITALYWFELYFGSTIYYGEVRDKQGLESMMLVTSIFLTYSFSLFKLNAAKRYLKRSFINFLFFVLVLGIQVVIYRLLEEPWRLWSS